MNNKSMKYTQNMVCTLVVTLTLIGSLTREANAALTILINESSDTIFDFMITGNFNGLEQPASQNEILYIVPIDSAGSFVTNWTSSTQFNLPKPSGAIDGFDVAGWGITDETRTDDFGFLQADAFTVSFSSPTITPLSSFSTDLSARGTAFNLNTSDIAGFNLYWGRTTLAASAAIPEPSSAALLLGLGGLGLVARRRSKYKE